MEEKDLPDAEQALRGRIVKILMTHANQLLSACADGSPGVVLALDEAIEDLRKLREALHDAYATERKSRLPPPPRVPRMEPSVPDPPASSAKRSKTHSSGKR
ncbi:MAG: hypothetical protein WA001_05910 [Patescibacteria group bacterium]